VAVVSIDAGWDRDRWTASGGQSVAGTDLDAGATQFDLVDLADLAASLDLVDLDDIAASHELVDLDDGRWTP
jgi:hypothetical protein